MHRTQVYLDQDTNEALDRLASRRRMSKAELIRLAAREYLSRQRAGSRHPLWELIGIGNSGYADTSARHDEVLNEIALERHEPL